MLVDQQCNKLRESPFPVNPAGFTIHSCIHEARDDAGCVLHTHSRAGVAVSAQKAGVLPLSQQSTLVLSSLAFHDCEGISLHAEEKPRLQARLAPSRCGSAWRGAASGRSPPSFESYSRVHLVSGPNRYIPTRRCTASPRFRSATAVLPRLDT